jgi:NADP-reducing hydrogenase subunit HndB
MLKSLEELNKLKEEFKQLIQIREGSFGVKIAVSMDDCGIASGARETVKSFLNELGKQNFQDASIIQTSCLGVCAQEPLVEISITGKDKITYAKINSERARQIVIDHVIGGHVIDKWVIPGINH